MRAPLRSAALLLVLIVSACRLPGTGPQGPRREVKAPDPIRLTLVGTNDIHGWVYPQKYKLADGTEMTEGGMPAFAGYVSILRKKNPGGVLLLDGGDMFQGTLASNLTEGAVVIQTMNRLGYTAAAIGNHEFDYGPVGPSPVALRPDQDPFGALKARLKEAKFPILAANIADAETGGPPDWLAKKGSVLFEIKGLRVGLIGLITPSTPSVTNPVNVQSLRFGALAPEAESLARALRDRGAEVVIGVAHAGGKCSKWDDPRDLSTCDRDHGEIFEMLDRMPPRTLDAVIAGHTHAPMAHYVNGTPVVETWGMGRYFSIIDLAVDPVKHRVLEDKSKIIPVIPICERVDESTQTCESRRLKDRQDVKLVQATFMGEPVQPDQGMTDLIAPALAQVEEMQNRPLGITAPVALTRSYEAESPLGVVLADALREREKADVAILNPGGLRADLRAGELRYGDMYEVIPFDNTVATLTMTYEELRRLLVAAYGARKGVFQISGLKVQISKCPSVSRLRSFTLENGKPLKQDKKYRVVMPDFLARGGDGLGSVMASLAPESVDLGIGREDNFRDAIVAYWQGKKGPLPAPKMGRVQFLDDGQGCGPGATLDLHSRE
ncbi:MAG TPA: bifunctional UDP-sugar hydrolase/5'-nucleotidase [Myxococcales bacterium]|nr:bifunctional UDP-sugar hydrolase/5'-nucleotidase [Myxococcales bacterium]